MLLLDTQIVLWLAREPERLSANALEGLRAAKGRQESLRVSVFSLWEVAMLEAKKRLSLEPSPEVFLERVTALYDVVPLDELVAVRSQRFSLQFPKDPADRIIAATALVHSLTLVTADEKIRESGEVPCLW